MTLTTTTGVLNARVAYVQHPSLTPAELCSVVARSGAISVRNCAGELSHSMVSTHPAVSMGSPGTYVWTFSNMPEGSWVEFSQNSAAHVEFTDFATTPWPEPPTTTSSTTTTTSTTSTTTAPVLEEVAAAIEVSDARAATRSVVGLGFALLVCVVALFVLLAIAVNVGRR